MNTRLFSRLWSKTSLGASNLNHYRNISSWMEFWNLDNSSALLTTGERTLIIRANYVAEFYLPFLSIPSYSSMGLCEFLPLIASKLFFAEMEQKLPFDRMRGLRCCLPT